MLQCCHAIPSLWPIIDSGACSCLIWLHGILRRPLVLGSRVSGGRTEYCVASEDCAFGPIGFSRVRDVAPGEMLVITGGGPRAAAGLGWWSWPIVGLSTALPRSPWPN